MTGIIEDEIAPETPIGEIIPPESKAAELFVPNGLDKIIGLIRKEVEQFQPDISTDKGRKAIASMARKVASSKSRLEDYGKNLSAKIKVQAVGIDAERKRMKETLDALRDQVRKPLDDYEAAVKARIDDHEKALRDVADLSNVPFGATVVDIEQRIATLDGFALRSWEEFAGRFGLANDGVSAQLNRILLATKTQDAERAAFAKLEAERITREAAEAEEHRVKEQAERDARIAREATEKAQAEAARREEQASLEVAESSARHLREQEESQARVLKAEQDAKESAERAVAAEQKRVADAEAVQAAEVLARESDKAYKAQIHNATCIDLLAIGISASDAKKVVIAIAQGKISSVKLVY